MMYGDIDSNMLADTDDTDIPLCKDCKHFSRSWIPILLGDYEYGRCHRPIGSTRFNLITGKGEIKKLGGYAAMERLDGHCGIQGKFWFSDKKKHLFTMLKRS
jgi:hypothetical protein